MDFSTSFHLSDECVQKSSHPVLCLRLETPRERLALPYAALTAVELSVDETTLGISFVTHLVVVKGHRLAEAYCAVAAGLAVALLLGRNLPRPSLLNKTPYPNQPAGVEATLAITAIRIEPIDVES
jgi:hypothetical protein